MVEVVGAAAGQINQICSGGVNPSVVARSGKERVLMEGLRGEAENGGRSPSSVPMWLRL